MKVLLTWLGSGSLAVKLEPGLGPGPGPGLTQLRVTTPGSRSTTVAVDPDRGVPLPVTDSLTHWHGH